MTTNPFLANFRPYISASVKTMRELTPVPLIVGTLLGIVFGASSLYLVLKVGLTVSASIPVAVISITLFRVLSKLGLRDATILEHNIVQTAGSAGESIAFGVGVTMPAIMILGFDLEFWRVTMVAIMGGLLGILMMIPLRRALIKDQHGYLKYPEGTACAEVLKAGANEESRKMSIEAEKIMTDDKVNSGGKVIGIGFGLGFLFNTLMQVFKSWKDVPGKEFGAPFQGGSISLENNPALLGVGYIIGPKIAGIMFSGGALAYLVLIPMIKFFGAGVPEPVTPATGLLIRDMALEGKDSIQSTYILYIGAGAVAAGGIISLFRSLPVIIHGIRSGIADFRLGNKNTVQEELPRTDQDLSMKWVVGGILALMIVIAIVPTLKMNILGAILIILFGFLFVTVSSRLTGEIGSSSNPISGMTVATLLLTCLVFLLLGWTQPDPYFVTALSVGGIVCIAASNGGTTSQDLKTGFHVGGTPWRQQIAILTGALASALVLGPILISLNNASTVYVPVAAATFPTEFRVQASQLVQHEGEPKQEQVEDASLKDSNSYYVWHNTEANGETGRYLVNADGKPVYLVDPGINGTIRTRVDGTTVTKYNAPKATLMSYIIKGILSQELPWSLVLLGVMIAVVLELSGIPSLAFAVGLYLPIAVSAPIFVGGLVRWMVDKDLIRKLQGRNLTEEEVIAETDKSPGVLLASGYIAGGALAGIMVALATEFLSGTMASFTSWSEAYNPFYAGNHSDWLALLPFLVLVVLLYYAGLERIFQGKSSRH
ncbi:oligopeptide transporter, OPT family [Rhodocytophaga aerolata]|uniref:Oligopeptide transporter, OPT family n=1 Tax=Rhodocytophaga aerolata TaxID=455078 RepID=A0ABT8R829_9BACT|nr:oligopeptide transporter, OPT family [Rhodocytophaga aerolata]MDO1448252.1 oligopeptide transporter, OPT family [Rhodocytophaga aerolata]